MRKWFFDINYHRHDAARRRSRRLVKLIVCLVLAIGIYVAVDAFFLSSKKTEPSDPTKAIQSHYDIPSNTFKTKYFEMETPETWQFQEKVSSANKFVYYNIRHKLARGMLFVYVNEKPVPAHNQATRLLPVRHSENGFLVPEPAATDHCNKTAPHKDKVGEETVKLKNITFMCDNDATWYTVLLGVEGGTPQMRLQRPDGTEATYVIYYQDSTANPTSADLVEVIRKFKVL